MLRVLFADDEPFMLEGLRSMIDWHKLGFVVCGEALDGEDALALMNVTEPHLVLTDVRMPVIDGLGLIEQASFLYPNTKFIILSGYADFDYAKRAMRHGVANYLMKPLMESELEKAVEAVTITIREQETRSQYENTALDRIRMETISRLLRGEKRQIWIEQAQALLDLDEHVRFRCLLLEPADEGTIDSNPIEMILETLQFSQATLLPFGVGKERQGFLLIAGPENQSLTPAVTMEMIGKIRSSSGSALSMAVSSEHRGPHALNEAFCEALMAEICRCPSDFDGVHFYQRERIADTADVPIGMTQSILDAVSNGNGEAVRDHVHQLFVALSRQSVSVSWVGAYLSNIKFDILRVITQCGGEPDLWVRKWFVPALAADLGILERRITQEFLQAAAWIGQEKSNKQDAVISAAEDYVKAHFSEKLQLQHVAEHFRMNSAYFGQRFKKQTGLTFNEYLHVVRIDEAKKLLRREELKISDIAGRVGYSDSEQFVSKFKSLTGKLPSAFKKG
ncbi:hypothetical protein A8709_14875 [Paenibacillus pectinilyticus]|uniref:DNA-binding response regulator n=1 Tax=Paenibacillus pectinilyticus TaxID=512399 RepID=A0A1C1A4A6_9BACL|nr:response regulator [Paenibacillus pectinilyticus]OCT15366.1 hypothetical protein A8709_14875 [Paenibacillus pectinilyticus]